MISLSNEQRTQEFQNLDALFDRLFPICRSITGLGYQKSLDILAETIPFETLFFKTSEKVLDWEVPPEWVIEEGYLLGPDGKEIVNFKNSNLHVVNYSEAVDGYFDLKDLLPHLHSIPSLPEAIPYVTSYYKRNWGFCMRDTIRKELKPGKYRAVIKSNFVNGGVRIGECFLHGESKKEILLSTYLCHPSLANNELSGPLVQWALYQRIKNWPRRNFTFRFTILPETIGSICYLSKFGAHLKKNLFAGLVLTCLGGRGERISLKRSRKDDSLVNKLAEYLNEMKFEPVDIREFQPHEGSDERQYCSPGFNLPVGQFARDVYGQYDGYHNSLDTKEYMGIDKLVHSVDILEGFLWDLDHSGTYINNSPEGEVQLGRRGLYPSVNSPSNRNASNDSSLDHRSQLNQILYLLNYSDGQHSLLDIAKKMKIRPSLFTKQIETLKQKGLLQMQ